MDRNRAGGQFLLTGSSPVTGTHPGAGRIATIRMRPLTLPERGCTVPTLSLGSLLQSPGESITGTSDFSLTQYVDEILKSGFPGFQELTGHPRNVQLDGYLNRIVDVELEEFGLRVRRPASVRAWLKVLAAATASTASWEKIRRAANPGSESAPARSTILPFIGVLTRLNIIDDLEAWVPS